MEKKINRQFLREVEGQKSTKKVYQKPTLVHKGDLRTITLGASPGETESSSGGTVPFHEI